ncbi:MAG: LysR family transcriptional regulator [Alphaproteobacteria bacterium]|nr:LysR family transcriptional regulator [Alphaproteobacteria bacterium]
MNEIVHPNTETFWQYIPMISDWDNLRVFLALAEEGTLSGAAKRLRVSHPTIARRIKALESELGTRLFDQYPDRFQPTEKALELLHDVKAMEAASLAFQRRNDGLSGDHLGTVRISIDETLAEFMTRHLTEVRENHRCIEFEITVTHMSANLSKREADLMIRSRVPDHASLIGRKIGVVAHAVYGETRFSDYAERRPEDLKELPWIGFDDDHQYMPGQAWQSRLLGNRKSELRTNNGVVLANAIRSGNGIGVLPCFLGDIDPHLIRLSPILEEATTAQWLLVHEDLRGVPKIRIVMDELIRLFHDRRAELEGYSVKPLAAPSASRPTLVKSA